MHYFAPLWVLRWKFSIFSLGFIWMFCCAVSFLFKVFMLFVWNLYYHYFLVFIQSRDSFFCVSIGSYHATICFFSVTRLKCCLAESKLTKNWPYPTWQKGGCFKMLFRMSAIIWQWSWSWVLNIFRDLCSRIGRFQARVAYKKNVYTLFYQECFFLQPRLKIWNYFKLGEP